ncbi:hypothetical protein [Silvibacterium dinghuense]|uniref:Type II secretion system protein GspE N-terminal domain-containing protein n=1 Tax=Silvibacterium dinghuense TaxID=1560006 RepID=A0A4Q1SEX9_9BACT|nr:hypothetical protein [Silvibacterium dinghuense]RXS95655.1 hypothetical protein ESZ00_13955 [Silvibacterium dinghuense]
MSGYGEPVALYRHRVPLGLMMLQRGWIDQSSLQRALVAQREGVDMRIGAWLTRHAGLSERRVTETLSLQWNSPVFTGDFDARVLSRPPLPRILIDACGVLPLRWSAMGTLHLAFESGIDHRLVLAFERLTGVHAEVGLLPDSLFARCRNRLLEVPFPRTRLLEAVTPEALAAALARQVERAQPAAARLVRYDRYFWLRMWPKEDAVAEAQQESEDVIAALVDFSERS